MATRRPETTQDAEATAIAALAFVAGDPVLLPRFLALTGIEVAQLRQAASEPGFLAGVLRFIAAHEPTLLRFAEETGTPPERVLSAMHELPGGSDSYMGST